MSPAHDTIAAPATAAGGAIAVIRVSGSDALTACDHIFRGKIALVNAAPYTVHYGRIVELASTEAAPRSRSDKQNDATESLRSETPAKNRASMTDQRESVSNSTTSYPLADRNAADMSSNLIDNATDNSRGTEVGNAALSNGDRIVDEVLVTVFRAPHSYTGEDSVEVSCHGSSYIVSEILRLLIAAGVRMAQPGEFTTRAFLAGKMDLAQAEAVADLIASSSRTAHALASAQMRGGFSAALQTLRSRLVHLMSMLELELDFSEEDVQFADRTELRETVRLIDKEIESLRTSFALGNALKRGVSVAIIGAPNVGKSTLLNRLLGEERAMVSDIAGTTRDAIEETADIEGVLFRFIDTAGIRDTVDRLEQMGIERTHAAIARAQIVIRMTDAENLCIQPFPPLPQDQTLASDQAGHPCAAHERHFCCSSAAVPNTTNGPDTEAPLRTGNAVSAAEGLPCAVSLEKRIIHVVNKIDKVKGLDLPHGVIALSAREGTGLERLRRALREAVDTETLFHGDAVVSSARHFEALTAAHMALLRTLNGLDEDLPADLLGEELRSVLYHLGTITGEITNDEILGNIFAKFCIGK